MSVCAFSSLTTELGLRDKEKEPRTTPHCLTLFLEQVACSNTTLLEA